jgi:hypothetical protein
MLLGLQKIVHARQANLATLAFLAAVSLGAQSWQLHSHGVGLLETSPAVRVLRTGGRWSLGDLARQGDGSTSAPVVFAAWIQGPLAQTFTRPGRGPAFKYKVRVIDPRGQSRTFGPLSFLAGGQAVHALEVQGGPVGTWQVEWFTVRTDSLTEARVAVDSFVLSR